MLNYFKKKIKSIIPFEFKPTLENVEFGQAYWDTLYDSKRWAYLDKLSELAHYSVIVGYCQVFAPEGALLEVGCGEAILQQRLKFLPYRAYTGIDISQKAIGFAQKFENDRTRFLVGDGTAFEDNNKFDIIIFNESLYCFNDCLAVLNHYTGLLTDDGIFVISMHVQEVSRGHWGEIGELFIVLDSVDIANKNGVKWQCKAVKPS